MYFKVAHHKKGTYVEELKKYMAYFLEQHFQQHMGERIAVIFDFSGAGLLNMVNFSSLLLIGTYHFQTLTNVEA